MKYSKNIWVFLIVLTFLLASGCSTSNLPIISYFSSSPGEIYTNESSHLNWSVTNASSITIDQGIGSVGAMGNIEVTPSQTTIYTLVANNSSGSVTANVEVQVLYNILGYWTINVSEKSTVRSFYLTFIGTRENGQVMNGSTVAGSYTVTGNEVDFNFIHEYSPTAIYAFTLKGELTDNEHMSGNSATVAPSLGNPQDSWQGTKT